MNAWWWIPIGLGFALLAWYRLWPMLIQHKLSKRLPRPTISKGERRRRLRIALPAIGGVFAVAIGTGVVTALLTKDSAVGIAAYFIAGIVVLIAALAVILILAFREARNQDRNR